MTLTTITIEPKLSPEYSVIWLHGLGADGNDFVDLVPQFGLEKTRFIFPNAPVRPVTINYGMEMRAWHDIPTLDIDGISADRQGIELSVEAIEALIAQEVAKGIKKNHIVVAGFSQGGAIALRVGLQNQALAGVLALSTYLAFPDEIPVANTLMPILMMHGNDDPVVPLTLGEHSHQLLSQFSYRITFKTYPMEHQLCLEQVIDIKNWLQGLMS